MPNVKVHSMTAATTIADTDEFYMVKDPFGPGYDRRVAFSVVKAYIQPGYSLQFATYNNNPTSATTYYFGGLFAGTMGTTGGVRRIYIPQTATLRRIWMVFTSNLGSAETSSVYFRLNNATDTLISSSVVNNASPSIAFNTSMSVSVSANDYFEIKWITPSWTTAPTAVSIQGVAWFS